MTAPVKTLGGAGYNVDESSGYVLQGPLVQQVAGLIGQAAPAGGAQLRTYAATIAATTGNIEFGQSYNCAVNPVSGVWAGRDVADICWLEKWGTSGGTKEFWYAPTAAIGVVPAWTLVYKIDMVNEKVTGPSPLFAAQNTSVAVTGTLTETELFNITIPGNTLGPNGALRIYLLCSLTNSANNKTLKLKFGNVNYLNNVFTAADVAETVMVIANRNSNAIQIGSPTSFARYGQTTAPVRTTAINTAVDQVLSITGQLGNVGETITLEAVIVEVLK